MEVEIPPRTKNAIAHEALMRLDHFCTAAKRLSDDLPMGATPDELVDHSVELIKEMSATLVDVQSSLLRLLNAK
tara:strand:- start:33 stop:254 length:222 start_codon:yes stop_codon:yes gene_type:complete